MGETSRDHEMLPPGERDMHLGDYNASPDVSAAHEYVDRLFHEAALAEEAAQASADFKEGLEAKIRSIFWRSGEIDKLIDKRPDAERLALRERRTKELGVLESIGQQADGRQPNLELVELRLTQADEALAALMHELEETEAGPETQSGNQ